MKSAKSRSNKFWEAKISTQRSSGLSRREFCQQHAIKLHQFNYRLKLSQQAPSPQVSKAFARVLVNDSKPAPRDEVRTWRLNLGAGISLDVDPKIEPRWLSALINELRNTP